MERNEDKTLEEDASAIELSGPITERAKKTPLFDAFLIHTGAQKSLAVDALHYVLSKTYGFRCFLDVEMNNNGGSPQQQMLEALWTSRYLIAVISVEFFDRKDPKDELCRAFDRMKFLRDRENYGWQSLWVILYNISVSEYDQHRVTHDLPDLGNEVVVYEWLNHGASGKYHRWSNLCENLGLSLVAHDDKDGAKEKWTRFTKDHGEGLLDESLSSLSSFSSRSRTSVIRKIRVRVHVARFIKDPEGRKHFFVNVVNESPKRELQISHVYFEDKAKGIFLSIQPKARKLPTRLKLDESWETWIPVSQIEDAMGVQLDQNESMYNKFFVRLTSGDVFDSERNMSVPQQGSVPGGPIEDIGI